MSHENVELVKRALDAFNRRDVSAFDEFYLPDFEWFPLTMGAVEREGFRGREGWLRYLQIVRATWEEFRVVGEEFRDLGQTVLIEIRIEARGKSGGVPVIARNTLVCDLRDRKIRGMRSYADHEEALKAARLDE
jgi:ketosteroid isomerase-like protein